MVAALFDISSLLSPLANGELILTANNRLRNHILRAYAEQQTAKGLEAWPAPRIFPLNMWLRSCWDELQAQADPDAAMMIASNLQRQWLWEDIIAHAPDCDALLQPEPLAQHADSALRNLELWRLTQTELLNQGNQNSHSFNNWLDEFKARLTRGDFITEETAHTIVARAFSEGRLPRLPRIYLQGFDDIPPLYRHLLTQASDDVIEVAPLHISDPLLQRVSASDDTSEIRAAALWAKQQLEKNSEAVIGIIVPNLGQCRDQVERLFTDVFEPLAALPSTPRYTLPFNFSAGTPLAATPLIHCALELLNVNREQWDVDPLCDLLLSPFFGDTDNETALRAQLCDRLRQLGRFSLSTRDLRFYAQRLYEKTEWKNDNHLAARLIALETQSHSARGQHSAAHWVDFFQQQLQILGWPGTRRLDSQEYQQVKLWHKVLDDFATLDSSAMRMDVYQALKQLRNFAGKTPFQAQTPDSPIQILGVLEGAGLRFSHCWVMGLHHRQWPPVPAPNPLLPLTLQKQQKMPHASAERELIFARALTENYRQCAQHVIFSSAHSDNENELRPSALIRDIPLTELADVISQSHSASQENIQRIATSKNWQSVHSAQGPKVALTGTPIRGGSSLFKHQAACPFNAFARLRLGATIPDAPLPGFSPIERGNLLHDALAIIWRELKNSQQLHALDDDALRRLIEQAAADALRPLQQKRPKELGKFYCQLEQERLVRLLGLWLEQEKTRPPFTVIAVEEARQIQFSGLDLTLRIDRIDQLENGDLLLIDYKTGSPKMKSWLSDRPDEPQLPLYAVTHTDPVSAIAFAQINAKAMQWIGMGELNVFHEGVIPPSQEWPLQLEEWQSILQHLAEDFIRGDARVDFKDINAQAYAQDLLPLNRALEADVINEFMSKQQSIKIGEQS